MEDQRIHGLGVCEIWQIRTVHDETRRHRASSNLPGSYGLQWKRRPRSPSARYWEDDNLSQIGRIRYPSIRPGADQYIGIAIESAVAEDSRDGGRTRKGSGEVPKMQLFASNLDFAGP